MSTASFAQKYLGKKIDYDGVYGYQCVDLIKQYLKEEYGLAPGSWGNAIDYWTKTNPALLTKFDRIASQSPQAGDIVILNGTAGNPYGHIAVATDANTMLEQNGSTGGGSGTGADAIRYRAIPKTRIAGLLRPKSQGGNDMPAKVSIAGARILAESILGRDRATTHSGAGDADLNKNHVGRDLTNEYLYQLWTSPEAAAYEQYQATVENFYKTYNSQIADLSARPTKEELAKLGEALKTEQAKVAEAEKALEEAKKQGGGISAEDSAAIKNTNSVVNWIKTKLEGLFK